MAERLSGDHSARLTSGAINTLKSSVFDIRIVRFTKRVVATLMFTHKGEVGAAVAARGSSPPLARLVVHAVQRTASAALAFGASGSGHRTKSEGVRVLDGSFNFWLCLLALV